MFTHFVQNHTPNVAKSVHTAGTWKTCLLSSFSEGEYTIIRYCCTKYCMCGYNINNMIANCCMHNHYYSPKTNRYQLYYYYYLSQPRASHLFWWLPCRGRLLNEPKKFFLYLTLLQTIFTVRKYQGSVSVSLFHSPPFHSFSLSGLLSSRSNAGPSFMQLLKQKKNSWAQPKLCLPEEGNQPNYQCTICILYPAHFC